MLTNFPKCLQFVPQNARYDLVLLPAPDVSSIKASGDWVILYPSGKTIVYLMETLYD